MSLGAFEKRNLCAIFLGIVVGGLLIAGLSSSWYYYSTTYNKETNSATSSSIVSSVELNATKIYYDLQGYKTVTVLAGVDSSIFKEYVKADGRVWNVFKACQALVVVGLILAILLVFVLVLFMFARIRNKFIFVCGMTPTRWIVIFHGIVLLLLLVVGFLVFLGITDAFEHELTTCTEGPCRKFMDSITTPEPQEVIDGVLSDITTRFQWGPDAGWWLLLVSIPIALLMVIIIVITKYPLPIDSEQSSGEAL